MNLMLNGIILNQKIMRGRIISIIGLLLFLNTRVAGQELHIYYNVFKDSLWYEKDGKSVNELKLKRGKRVKFHLVDFNNYLYKANFKAINSPSPYISNSPDPNNYNNQYYNNNYYNQGLAYDARSGNIPSFNIPIFGSLLQSIGSMQGLISRGDDDEIKIVKELVLKLDAEKTRINEIASGINIRKKAITNLFSNNLFSKELLLNKSIAPSQIKEILLKQYRESFLIEDGQDFTMEDIKKLNEKFQEIPALQAELEMTISDYQNKISELRITLKNIINTTGGDENIALIQEELMRNDQYVQKSLNNISNAIQDGYNNLISAGFQDFSQVIKSNYFKYIELKKNTFSYTHESFIEDKYLHYQVDILRKDTFDNVISDQPVKNLVVKVTSFGASSINTTIGIAATQFSNIPQKFYIKNDAIAAQDLDPYTPMALSLINFNFDLEAFDPAISLGFGIPISNTEALDNLAFFLAPGVYLGKSRTFMVSLGMMFSKVERLSSAVKIGDVLVYPYYEIPTFKKYEIGYFLGLTYNISGR